MTLATLSVQPEFVLETTKRYRVVEGDWRQGMHMVAVAAPYTVRTWELQWNNDTGADRALVQAQWDASKGGAGVFNWTPPGGSATAVRFAMDSFEPAQVAARTHAFRVSLLEAINHDG